ncbi:glycosyltransferase family 39 protein [bacterium]|nr:glycosyltransferase family 39 protein [bacterium]
MSERNTTYPTLGILLLILALAVMRAPHLSGPLDTPNTFRQADVAQCALDFYRNGIDLMHPRVCWLGDRGTIIFDFPIVEAIMAVAYRAAGGENLTLARLVHLAFFLAAAVYLFLLAREFFDDRIALTAAAIYGVLPLSLGYSRAVHVDFAAVACAHAMAFHFVAGYGRDRPLHFIAAAIAATLAFLIKVPYAFYFALPAVVVVAFRFKPRMIGWMLPAIILPLVSFALWRAHAHAVNATAPDWWQIPGYKKLVDMNGWYYGPFALRFDPQSWRVLGRRFLFDVATPVGAPLFILGLIGSASAARQYGRRAVIVAWTLFAGVVLYVLIFFNLNRVHDYYQIPLLAPVALFIALALDRIACWAAPHAGGGARAVPPLGCVLIAIASWMYAESRYYHPDAMQNEIARIVESSTPPDALWVASWDGATQFEPRMLYPSHRNGWSVRASLLTPEAVEVYRKLGASLLVVASTNPPANVVQLIERFGGRTMELKARPWKAVVVRLEPNLSK